jgi:hypothetical protein
MNGIVGTRGDGARRDSFYLDGGFHMKQRTWKGSEWVVNVRRGGELQRMVSGGQPVRMAVLHKGTDSAATCGAKSEYVVTWSIRQSTA